MGLRVLVIDDDELQLALTRTLLTEAGYAVTSTADGPQGIDIYREERPDLVLLDLGLPSMSGISVLQAIRAIDARARVIVLTGYASRESADEARQNGAMDFIEKTVSQEVLLEKIRAVINRPDTPVT